MFFYDNSDFDDNVFVELLCNDNEDTSIFLR